MFFSAWMLRQHLVLDQLELRARSSALSACFSVLSSLACAATSSAVPLLDLLIEVGQLGAPVERVAELLLPVELDERIARLHRRPRP